jgi:hypothetical protein
MRVEANEELFHVHQTCIREPAFNPSTLSVDLDYQLGRQPLYLR